MSSQTFPKDEHLKGRKLIQTLFHKGKAFSIFPLKVYYLSSAAAPAQVSVRAGFSVPIRNFKKAVHRNRIKRQMREAYRLQKQDLQKTLGNNEKSLVLFFIYTGNALPSYSLLFKKMHVSLNRLAEAIQSEDTQNETVK